MDNDVLLNKLLTPLNDADIQPLYETFTDGDALRTIAGTEKPRYFLAAAKRAEALGIEWDRLLAEYSERLMKSTYPTPACLSVQEVQAYSESSELTPEQRDHIASCEPCRVLLEAACPSADDLAGLMEGIHVLAIRATTPSTADTPVEHTYSAGRPSFSAASKMVR